MFTRTNLFFTYVQPAYPMFCRHTFDQDLEDGKVPDRLLNAMFAVSSRFSPPSEISILLGSSSTTLWDSFARLAEHQKSYHENQNEPISLNDVKTEALLTLYEYTNFPGRKAWMMVGNLVRAALAMGLHLIDSGRERDPSFSDLQLEECRFVWWTVWKLDSAINTLAGSPFGIDSHCIGTALVSTSIADFTAGIVIESSKQYLSMDSERPWKSAQQLVMSANDDGLGMYLLAVSHLRDGSRLRQRLYINPTPQLVNQLTILRNALSCMRLSLPVWYFEPERQSSFETPYKHRTRLETLLIFYA